MNPAELHKRVAEVLGVSASQKNLAFEVLTESIAEILTEGITLKVPRVGFFQLKADAQKNNSVKQLMFSSLPEDFDPSEKALYHTFEINSKYKNSFEPDSQVFSIGVGKPLLPLHDEEASHDPETSFAMLRKSIEERVKEILAESDQIPNFNIWEDIYSDENETESDSNSDITSKLFDLTKDLHFDDDTKTIEPEIEPQHQNFLKTLLANNKPEASSEFFEEEKSEQRFSIEAPEQKIIDEEIYKIDDAEPASNLSLTELLGEVDWMRKIDMASEPEEEVKTSSKFEDQTAEEQIDITIPEHFAEQHHIEIIENITLPENEIVETPQDDVITEQNFNSAQDLDNGQEHLNFEENLAANNSFDTSAEKDILQDLLNDEESNKIESVDYEITIEPPMAAVELLVKNSEEDKTENLWAIEEEDLKGIINEELREYDHEKIASDNSRVLNDLLEDAFHRKVDIDSTGEYDEEVSADEISDEDVVSDKIEWSWGDELKEEFGIGKGELIEDTLQNPFSLIIEQDEFTEPKSFENDLEKTRQDLFSRLEKTLEREVTSLRDNFDNSYETDKINKSGATERSIYTKPEISAELRKTKIEEPEQPVVEFKDEKVYLDFKTPPPRYEFIEESPPTKIQEEFAEEPILTKPKRMTILLERNDFEEASKISEPVTEPEHVKVNPEKSVVGKLFAITLGALVLVIAFAVYLYFKVDSPKQEISQQQAQAENQEQNSNNITENSANTVSRESLGLNPDDFSEFPTTATPPEPVKEGGSVDVSKLLEKQNLPKNEEILRQSEQDGGQTKAQLQQNNKQIAGETRLNDMVFFDGKSYNFQISSWKNKALADSEVNRLRAQGFNAFLVEAFLPDKGGTWYRIRIGSFKSEKEALDFKKRNSF